MRLSQNVARNNLKIENYENIDNSDIKFGKNQIIDFEEKNLENEDDNEEYVVNENKSDNKSNNINNNQNDAEIPQIRNKTEPNIVEENDVIFASDTSNSHYVKNQNRNDKKPVEFINFTTTIQNKNLQIENLVINVHDTTVKPIIGNKDIENYVEPQYNSKQLSLKPYKPEEIVTLTDNDVQKHKLVIYKRIKSNSIGLTEKLQLFNYFETLIVDSNLANRLVNSEFLNVIINMLQDKKINLPVNLKQRLCSIIGQMVRHATQIESDVINKGLANCLIDVVRNDNTAKVRKTAIAALGEYLF